MKKPSAANLPQDPPRGVMQQPSAESGTVNATPSSFSRRRWVQGVGLGVVTGCLSADETSLTMSSAGGSAPTGSPSGDSSMTSAPSWNGGGTAAMRDAASYPNPFEGLSSDDAGGECPLTCRMTQGPCWGPSGPLRQDISEGEPGLPMRLALRVLDSDGCTPLQGAEIEIWYCNAEGAYSGSDLDATEFCTGGDERARTSYFFRGRALTNVEGTASFDGCFPGWYPGRAVHIHLLVRPASAAGETTTESAVAMTQLFFPEQLTQQVFSQVEEYVRRGQPDTPLSADGIVQGAGDLAPFTVGYQRMSDGALLAWKSIVINADESC